MEPVPQFKVLVGHFTQNISFVLNFSAIYDFSPSGGRFAHFLPFSATFEKVCNSWGHLGAPIWTSWPKGTQILLNLKSPAL